MLRRVVPPVVICGHVDVGADLSKKLQHISFVTGQLALFGNEVSRLSQAIADLAELEAARLDAISGKQS